MGIADPPRTEGALALMIENERGGWNPSQHPSFSTARCHRHSRTERHPTDDARTVFTINRLRVNNSNCEPDQISTIRAAPGRRCGSFSPLNSRPSISGIGMLADAIAPKYATFWSMAGILRRDDCPCRRAGCDRTWLPRCRPARVTDSRSDRCTYTFHRRTR